MSTSLQARTYVYYTPRRGCGQGIEKTRPRAIRNVLPTALRRREEPTPALRKPSSGGENYFLRG